MALRKVPHSISLALYRDETATASTWASPATHEYEAWSDARAFDGTITIQQPQARRLYGGHSPHELLAVLQGDTMPDDYTLLRTHWQETTQQQGVTLRSLSEQVSERILRPSSLSDLGSR
jgi:hypothetical protein